jgi:2-methylcitrate dehydratase PrpD
MTPVEVLAAWASGIAASDVPAAQHRRARLRLLDTLGLIAVAAEHPAGRSLAAWAGVERGTGAHVLITGSPASPAVAALVHGALAHARDFDDSFAESVVHPGSIVVAATLASAERTAASFDAITTAITIGYEISARIGAVAGRAFHARGFHATGIVGPIAAAGAAARVLALDPAAMSDALGLATSMSSGLLAFLADGSWSKWLHTGWSAHGGIVAADLASTGFRGPRHALDHQYGLYGAFIGRSAANVDAVTAGLGKDWLGSTASAKSFPCAHVIQPFVETLLALRASERLQADDVLAVHCFIAPWAMPIVGVPRAIKIAPSNDLEAIASLPFMAAAALCEGRVDVATLRAETLGRGDIRSLAARIECSADESLGSGFDGHMLVELRGGRQISRAVALSEPSEQQIVARFRANTGHLPPDACAELERTLLNEAPRADALVRLALAAMAGRGGAAQ